MTKSSNTFKKSYFWSISPFLEQKDFFPKNLSVTHNTTWASKTMLSLKANERIPRKLPDGRSEGEKDEGQKDVRADRP